MLNNGVPFSAAYNDGTMFSRSVLGKDNGIRDKGKVPKIGMIILYNEIIKWQDRNMPRPYRGCGIVSAETDYLIFIDRAIFPGCFIKTSFPKSDFELGLVKYVQLKSFIYKRETTYHDLDIQNLKGKIRSLVIEA